MNATPHAAPTEALPLEPSPRSPTWRLFDGAAPRFTSLDGRVLRFSAELDAEDDYALADVRVLVETYYGSTCCELVSVDIEHATDKASAAEWVREHVSELADQVVYR